MDEILRRIVAVLRSEPVLTRLVAAAVVVLSGVVEALGLPVEIEAALFAVIVASAREAVSPVSKLPNWHELDDGGPDED